MRKIAFVVAVVGLGGCGGGCGHEADAPAAPMPAVRVELAAFETVQAQIQIAGLLAPLPGRDVKVGALVGGRVDRVLVAEGDRVRVGQALAHVEALPLRERLVETLAQKAQAGAQLDNARTRLKRTEALWKDGIVSKQEVDDARAALVVARSGVTTAQAIRGTAAMQLARATLRAPIDGVVAAVLVPAGQPVDGSGTPVIEIADTRVLDLRAPVPAGRIAEVTVGQSARLAVDGLAPLAGTVQAIAPLVDSATNTVLVRVRIQNQGGRLRGGMFASGALLGVSHRGLTVPRSALLPGDGGTAGVVAVVVESNVVAHRQLSLGTDSGDRIEVRGGLAAGDRVIVAGGYTLPDGVTVRIEGSASPARPALVPAATDAGPPGP